MMSSDSSENDSKLESSNTAAGWVIIESDTARHEGYGVEIILHEGFYQDEIQNIFFSFTKENQRTPDEKEGILIPMIKKFKEIDSHLHSEEDCGRVFLYSCLHERGMGMDLHSKCAGDGVESERLGLKNKTYFKSLFIHVVNKFFPLGEMRQQIMDSFGVGEVFEFESVLKELKTLVDASKFKDALELAKSLSLQEDEDINVNIVQKEVKEDNYYYYVDGTKLLYALAKYCEDKKLIREVIACCEVCDPTNEYYEELNELAAYHLLGAPPKNTSSKNEVMSLDQDEESEGTLLSLERPFIFMSKAKKTPRNMEVLARLFHRLCGKEGLKPDIADITLPKIAKYIRQLNQENAKLRQANQALLSQIEELERHKGKRPLEQSSALLSQTSVAASSSMATSSSSSNFFPGAITPTIGMITLDNADLHQENQSLLSQQTEGRKRQKVDGSLGQNTALSNLTDIAANSQNAPTLLPKR